jgi:23S rRNA (guanosine2251-2'-O)-methyltransferase
MRKLRNEELDRLTAEEIQKKDKNPIVIVLDNLRSRHNVGSAFRTADAFLCEKIMLCGITRPTTASRNSQNRPGSNRHCGMGIS